MIEAPITTAAATPTVGPGPKEETPEAGTLPAPQAQRYIDLARTAFKRYLCIHWPSFRVQWLHMFLACQEWCLKR